MDLACFGKGGDMVWVGYGAAYRSWPRTHTVDRTDVRDGQKVERGVFIVCLVVVVVIIIIIVVGIIIIVLGLGQVAQTHNDDFVLGLALAGDLTGLCTGDDPRGVRVRRTVSAEVVAENVKRQTRPGIGEGVEGEVD